MNHVGSEEVLLWMLWRKIAFPSEGAKLASSFDAMRRARDANRQTDAQVRETVIRQVIPTIDILKGIPVRNSMGSLWDVANRRGTVCSSIGH